MYLMYTQEEEEGAGAGPMVATSPFPSALLTLSLTPAIAAAFSEGPKAPARSVSKGRRTRN